MPAAKNINVELNLVTDVKMLKISSSNNKQEGLIVCTNNVASQRRHYRSGYSQVDRLGYLLDKLNSQVKRLSELIQEDENQMNNPINQSINTNTEHDSSEGNVLDCGVELKQEEPNMKSNNLIKFEASMFPQQQSPSNNYRVNPEQLITFSNCHSVFSSTEYPLAVGSIKSFENSSDTVVVETPAVGSIQSLENPFDTVVVETANNRISVNAMLDSCPEYKLFGSLSDYYPDKWRQAFLSQLQKGSKLHL